MFTRPQTGPRHRPSQTAPRPAGFRGRAQRPVPHFFVFFAPFVLFALKYRRVGAGSFLMQRKQSGGDAEGAVFSTGLTGWAGFRAGLEINIESRESPFGDIEKGA